MDSICALGACAAVGGDGKVHGGGREFLAQVLGGVEFIGMIANVQFKYEHLLCQLFFLDTVFDRVSTMMLVVDKVEPVETVREWHCRNVQTSHIGKASESEPSQEEMMYDGMGTHGI